MTGLVSGRVALWYQYCLLLGDRSIGILRLPEVTGNATSAIPISRLDEKKNDKKPSLRSSYLEAKSIWVV
jgi:hypothetical protein